MTIYNLKWKKHVRARPLTCNRGQSFNFSCKKKWYLTLQRNTHDTCLPNCSVAAKAIYSTDDKKGNEENHVEFTATLFVCLKT